MTPERNDNTENGEDRELGSPTQPESPSPSPANLSEWIMQGLNQINERLNRIENKLDEIGKDVGDLKERVARVEEKITPIPQIEKKIVESSTQCVDRHWNFDRYCFFSANIFAGFRHHYYAEVTFPSSCLTAHFSASTCT